MTSSDKFRRSRLKLLNQMNDGSLDALRFVRHAGVKPVGNEVARIVNLKGWIVNGNRSGSLAIKWSLEW